MAVKNPKEIIDADALLLRIAEMRTEKPDADAAILKLLKKQYKASRTVISNRFENSNKSAIYLSEMTHLVDMQIRIVYKIIKPKIKADGKNSAISCIAVGGYGRKELFPYSDIDLLFLYEPKHRKQAEAVAEAFLHYLWDLGFQVGHALRTINETIELAKQDHTVAANLLDTRFLQGNKKLYSALVNRYQEQIQGQNTLSFIAAKLAERNERHQKHGDSRFLLEPNIKENKGALRDLHTLYWLAHYCYGTRRISELVTSGLLTTKERRDFKAAEQFLWTVRIHLHLLSSRAEERLTFDMQKQISERLGFRGKTQNQAVERFMKRYFQMAKAVGNLTGLFCAILEEEQTHLPRLSLSRLLERQKHIDGFILKGQRLDFKSPEHITQHPVLILRIFRAAQIHNLEIHPRALQRISSNLALIDDELRHSTEANQLFLDMLLSKKGPEIILRKLNEAGVLGKFIPDFGRIVGQMQFDMYHVYTVDEHTIRALGILHAIETGKLKNEVPLSSEIIQHVGSRAVLYLSLLCHDIAKGRGGNHAVRGSKIVRKLCRRFDLTEHEANTAEWLVREHILCADVAFKRDLDDPSTIKDFVEAVQSPERLRLLLVLSVADIRAVGPTIWNPWKGELLRKLYYRSEEQMGSAKFDTRQKEINRFRDKMRQALAHWSEEERDAYFEAGFPRFWLSFTLGEHIEFAHMILDVANGDVTISTQHEVDQYRSITHLKICLPYHHALLAHISGSVTLVGGSILSAKLFDLRNGLAIALLEIQNIQHGAFADEKRLHALTDHLMSCVKGGINLDQAVMEHRTQTSDRLRALDVTPRIFIDNKISNTFTVIEVTGLDRPGFLYDVTSALIGMRLTIANAYITTYGEKAVDVFYVKDLFGLKVTHPDKLKHIENHLLALLLDDAPRQAS